MGTLTIAALNSFTKHRGTARMRMTCLQLRSFGIIQCNKSSFPSRIRGQNRTRSILVYALALLLISFIAMDRGLGIDAFDGTPEDVRYDGFLQQTMTKIDTRPVYTVSVRLMPQGIYPDPAPPAQPGHCYFTTTWGSLQIDKQVYTQANGSSSDFYDIVVPGIVQPSETAILKLDFSCDPGFIGMGSANVIIDRVYIVPTLLCT